MREHSDSLSKAIAWLREEIPRTPFGRLSIGVQMHEGRISKIFRSVEECTLASQGPGGQVGDGSSR
jgi:hypothetical protein